MTDRIRIICSNCRQTFSERANRLKPGYQVQCVHCGDVPIAVELRRADVARNECYAALVTWATGLIVMRSW